MGLRIKPKNIENPEKQWPVERIERTQIVEYNGSESGKANTITRSILSSDGISAQKIAHSVRQAYKHGITDDQIQEALKNPLQIIEIKYDLQGKPSKNMLRKEQR